MILFFFSVNFFIAFFKYFSYFYFPGRIFQVPLFIASNYVFHQQPIIKKKKKRQTYLLS